MDLQKYIASLDSNTHKVLEIMSSFNDNTIRDKSNEGWSSFEILEHITLTDIMILSMVSRPTNVKSNKLEILGEEKLKFLLTSTSDKVEAPEILKPRGVFLNLEILRLEFIQIRNLIKTSIKTEELKFDYRVYTHSVLGDMTTCDWLYFLIYHTDRHLAQIYKTLNIGSNVFSPEN